MLSKFGCVVRMGFVFALGDAALDTDEGGSSPHGSDVWVVSLSLGSVTTWVAGAARCCFPEEKSSVFYDRFKRVSNCVPLLRCAILGRK